MKTLRYISPKPPRARDAVSRCVFQRDAARFICERAGKFEPNLGEKTHI
jgi:hypothetical protein